MALSLVSIAYACLQSNAALPQSLNRGERHLCAEPIDFGYIAPGPGIAPRKGIDLDIVDALSARTGCHFKPVELPPARILHELDSGLIGMSSRWFETPERTATLWFAHFQLTKNLAIYRPSRTPWGVVRKLPERDEVAIGTVRAFHYGSGVDIMLTKLTHRHANRLVVFGDRLTSFEGLRKGRVQVIFLPLEVFEGFRSRLSADEAADYAAMDLFPSEPAIPGGLVMAKSRFDSEAARRWKEVVDELCREGKVLQIFRRYYPASSKDLACQLKHGQ